MILDGRLQANALIELFRSISVFGKWPKNRLVGQMTVGNSLVADFSTSAKSPRHSETVSGKWVSLFQDISTWGES